MSQSQTSIPVEVEAERDSPTKSTVQVRDFELVVDEPQDMGGSNDGPNPLEYLLASQAGCLNVTASEVADDMGIDLDELEIEIGGQFDVAAFQTERPDDRTGVQDIDVTLEAEADVDDETLRSWGDRVEERCPVSDNIKHATDVSLTVERS